jgi:hypothetical protein
MYTCIDRYDRKLLYMNTMIAQTILATYLYI